MTGFGEWWEGDRPSARPIFAPPQAPLARRGRSSAETNERCAGATSRKTAGLATAQISRVESGSNVVRAAWRRLGQAGVPRLSTSACFFPFYTGRGACRTNHNSLIAIGLGEIWFVSYFFLCFEDVAGLHGLPHDSGRVKYFPQAVNGWLRAGNRAHPAGPRPDGHGSFRCSTPASLRDSYPVQPAENSRTRGPNDTPAARSASGQESPCLRDRFDPVFGQKRPPGGVKRWPRSGLAGDFRHLAVGWQARRAAMGAFCLMVKSSEL